MTLEEINALEIEDVSEILGQRLLVKDLPVTSENLETEFLLYKQELYDTETERLRIKNLKNRWRDMEDKDAVYPAFRSIFPNTKNPKKYFIDMLRDLTKKEEIEALMVRLETKDAELDLQRTIDAQAEQDKIDELKSMKKDLIEAISGTELPNIVKKFLKRLAREEFKKLRD